MKKIISLVLMLVFLLTLQLPAAAQDYYYNVFDEAGMLSEEEAAALDSYAYDVSEEYEVGVYFISVDDFNDIDSDGAYEAAKTLYQDWGLGYGGDASGVLLMMSLSNRKMALIAHGYGNAAITDGINQSIRDSIKPYFKEDNWNDGVEVYISMAAQAICNAQENGVTEEDVVVYTEAPLGYRIAAIVVLFLLAMLVAFLVTQGMKSQLKSVAPRSEALEYTGPGDLHLSVQEDQFTHTTTTRQYSPESKDSDSGGSTSVDSDGFSGSDDDF